MIGTGILLLCVGLVYAGLLVFTDFSLQCPFYAITGLNCPGCGITGMCLAFLRGDISAAFVCNRGLFLILPLLGILIAIEIYRYVWGIQIKDVSWKIENRLSIILVVYMLIWAVVRNTLKI